MNAEILDIIKKKGLLLEKDIFELIEGLENTDTAKTFLTQLEKVSRQKIITKNVLSRNFRFVKDGVGELGGESKVLENLFIKLGLEVEVTRERVVVESTPDGSENKKSYSVVLVDLDNEKKLEVKDFTGCFRSRFQQLQRILMQRQDLINNLVSINKISSDRSSLSIIGIVVEKRITKNRNMIIKFEDLTGEISCLVKFDREDVFEKAEELQLDDIVGVKASGNRDLLFIQDILFPDAFLNEKTRFEEEICVAFLSDVHCGSKGHLKDGFEKFLSWLNSGDEFSKKVKYVFFTGDNVDGVGIFPGQEELLELKSMGEQYALLANYLKRIPKNITIFMCPGQHDASRVAEPQPPISKKYAPELYEIENLVLVSNPAMIKLLEGEKEFKILMYHGASIHKFINEIKELREMKAHRCPAKAVRHMLKRRHLAPTHSDSVYIPNVKQDPLVISEVPDALVTGEVHRLDIENYNGVLIITGSCWQAQTEFEEKIGNIPDPCKVPILNLKSRALKVFDFGTHEKSQVSVSHKSSGFFGGERK